MKISFITKLHLFLLLPISLALNSCKDSSGLKNEFIGQRILDYKPKCDSLTISGELLKWDTSDFVVKYLDKKVDTTTHASELINTSPYNRDKIISLFSGLIKKEIASFKDQINNQLNDPPVKGEKKIKGEFRMNEILVKFSQPLFSLDNNTIIIKEWTSDGYCWTKAISVYQKIDNKWKLDFDIDRRGICR